MVGDQPTITGYFTDIDTHEPVDPSAIVIRVRKPDGTITDYNETNCTNPAVGTWRFLLPSPIDQDGKWSIKFSGTAGVVATNIISFAVECSEFD